MPLRKNWKKSAASRKVMLGRRLMMTDEALHTSSLGFDEGLASSTDLFGSVPLTAVPVMPSQGSDLSDGGAAHPTCPNGSGHVLRPSDLVSHEHYIVSKSECNITDKTLGNTSHSIEHFTANNTAEATIETENGRTNQTFMNIALDITRKSTNSPKETGVCSNFSASNDTTIVTYSAAKIFKAKKIVMGSFHKADNRFSSNSRGNQCTINSLCALIYASLSHLKTATSEVMDEILTNGDNVYNKIVLDLKATGQFKSNLLNFDEIPPVVNIFKKDIAVMKFDVISGVCTQQFATIGLPTLNETLKKALQQSPYLLIMIGSICSAVFKKDQEFFFFDSHSHAQNGLSHPDGRSLLVSFSCLEDLVTFMYALYDSMLTDISSQFDMLPVNLEVTSLRIQDALQSTDVPSLLKVEHGITPCASNNEWEMVSSKRHKNIKSFARVNSGISSQNQSTTQITPLHVTDKQEDRTLICQYFEDQMQRNRKKIVETHKHTDRKIYQRLYKQRQRVSKEFRSKEQVDKKNARQSDKKRIKDRESNLRSMRKSRESEMFKNKERDDKRNARYLDEKRIIDKESSYKSKRKARQSLDFKTKETIDKRHARLLDANKKKDKESTFKYKRKSRESIEFKNKERDDKRDIRLLDANKMKDRESAFKSKRKARQCIEFKNKERDYKRHVRILDANKMKDRESTSKSKSKARQSIEFKNKERNYKRHVRMLDANKMKNRESTLQSKRKSRESVEFKNNERDSKRNDRLSHEFKIKETKIQRKSKRKARLNPFYLEKERLSKQALRKDSRNKWKANNDCFRKAEKRKTPFFREKEKEHAKHRKYGHDIRNCIAIFQKCVSDGPVYVCSCCHQTWFRQSVFQVNSLSEEQRVKYLTKTLSVDDKEWICSTCKTSISSGKIPRLSVLNGMEWPSIPKELQLFPLEERLIALRIPFMQIRELPRGRQLSVKGNVVNVPVDIQPVVNALPRPFDENVTIAVKLKKKLSFKSCVFSENVRPLRVLTALHWLLKNSILYKNANVQLDEDWIRKLTEDSTDTVKEFFTPEANVLTEEIVCSDDSHKSADKREQQILDLNPEQHASEELYDSDTEASEENVGNVDTLLDDANIENRNSAFIFAPGEGQQPISIYQDKDSEYLSFPTIFCGQARKENEERLVPVHYSDVAKWELRSKDRRAANSVPNIFFKLKKIQMKQLNDKVNLAIRRCQPGRNKVTASEARNNETVDNIVKKDEGYYLFKQIRNSPAYLETRKKDMFAMIRQLGLPTWFLSLSSADTRWNDLLKMLVTLNDKVNYNEDQFAALTWEQKIKLIQSDPVTCSRYFDNRVQQFIHILLKSEHEPLGKVTDYFYRVEFQQRGSPHIHMLVWVENSPKYQVNTNDEVSAYVDEFVQCSFDDEYIGNLTELQIHNHSRSCKKKKDRICRFGYPLPPLPCTMVLEPLEADKEKYYTLYQQLQKKMNEMKQGYDMSYEVFLKDIVQMTEEEYIRCIRSSLNTSKVFLKRNPNEIRINLYNKVLLQAWKANIDIQLVLDPYACAMYIVSYISKSQRGMSSLLHAAAKEASTGNLDIKRQVRHIGNAFSNSVEVSAQEAVYLILQMPLTKSTRDVVFINTSNADERVHLLKPKHILDELPADSTDIVSDNMLKRYSKRPKVLEKYCLADYVSQLNIVYPATETDFAEINDDEQNDEDYFGDSKTILTMKNGVEIKRRKNYRVIRYVRYNPKTNEENHFREKLLLFYPWRNEESDLLGTFTTYRQHYESMKENIDVKCAMYEHHVEELELAKDMAEADVDAYDEIAPGTEQVEADTAEEKSCESESFIYFNPDRVIEHRNYDIGIEIGCSVSSVQVNVNETILQENQYRDLLRSLNQKQKHFHNHVIHWIKTNDAPLYAFLSGGAGVGKSVVIRALYQSLYRYLNLKEGENVDETRVLLCAYTGKAAFNIGGSTISSAFKQKYKQSNQTLTCDNLNSFRSKYRSLSVVIVDEISMVSNSLLSFMDQRLQELKGTRRPFGGVSIIAVGDLYQLKPVSGDWIFNDLSRDAAALANNLWKDHFSVFELTEVMRQRDDLEFAELLNRLRKNSLTDEDRVKLQNCHMEQHFSNYMINAPHLFAENFFMHSFNDLMINKMQTDKVVIPSHDSVMSPKLSREKQEEAVRKLPTDPNKTANLHCSLTVVVDMIYDLTVNINTEDGLANGASCTVKYVEYKQTETNRPSIIWVQFDDTTAGMETRQKYKNRDFYHHKINEQWTPVFDIERSFTYNRKTFQRIQFPLQPSAGRSVHRAQGTTLERVVIDLSQRKVRKVPHLHYVALSRVKSLKNLQILNFNEQALKVDGQVQTEMERLHQSVLLHLCYVPFDTINSELNLKFAFNNCRSLHLHFDDIRHDLGLLSSHAFGVAESRLNHLDGNVDYKIEGFTLVRNDQKEDKTGTRPAHGLAVFINDTCTVNSQTSFTSKKLEFTKLSIRISHNYDVQFVILYKSPTMPNNGFSKTLKKELGPLLDKSKPVVVMGDFNLDVYGKDKKIVQDLCGMFSCNMCIKEPTTDNNSTLDLVFSNTDGIAGTIETYWSDHKIITFHVPHLK